MAAGASGADKCIGKLTLDISNVESQIKKVQELLKSVGAGVKVDLSKNIAAEVKKQLDAVQKEIENGSKKINEAAQKAVEAINQIGSAKASDKEKALMNKLEQRYLKFENKMQAEADKTLAKMEANAQKEAAAVEKAAERKAAAREKAERQYEDAWKKAEMQRQAAEEKSAAAAEKATQKTEAMYKQMFDRIAREEEKANAKRTEEYTMMFIKSEQEALDTIIKKYQEYFDWKSKAVNAESNGNIASRDMYTQNAHDAYAEIQRLASLYPDLIKVAEASDTVKASMSGWLNSINTAAVKEVTNDLKEQDKEISNYAKALAAYFAEIDNLQKQMASGRVTAGSEQYKAFTDNIARLKEEARQAGANLDNAGKQAAAGMQEVQKAVGNLSKSSAALRDSASAPTLLADIKQRYFELTDAIKNYNAALKSGDKAGMSHWQTEISLTMQQVQAIEQALSTTKLEASEKQQILNIIQQCNTAQNQYNASLTQSMTRTSELESQMTGLLTRMFSIMAVIRTISNLVNSTVEYVSEYYDKMNEIQIITQKSNAEVAQLADTYRDIAEMMNVSSLDMADAAIYFTRQGLGAAEIEERLKNVTMYAKTANVEFTEAAEIITAVVNSMGLVEQEAEDGRNAAQRVADVFLLVGDNAATSGQEIGSAMQKAAAAAGSFGVSMEWLASYIATVSETTRQEARTIGTALNTIIARLHSIRTTGYNADDNTKVNDIAKALHTVNIELMDQYGNWRDMEDIFEDVAGVWDTLTGKQKSYIATTMAGVKQQNVFLALMKDMAKGAENGSRAYELYNLAVNSAGTAEEKYATYKDSVAASQERLNVAQEKFYSLLDASVIKSWNDAMAGYVNMITDGAEAWGNWTIILPAVAGAITAVIVALKSAKAAAAGIETFFTSHPIISGILAAIGVLATLITMINAVGSQLDVQKKRFEEASKAIDESTSRITQMANSQKQLADMAEEIGDKTNMTSAELEKYNGLLSDLAGLSPECKDAVDKLKNGIGDQKDAVAELNEEIERLIDNEKYYRSILLADKYSNWTPENIDENNSTFLETMASWKDEWKEGEKGLSGFANQLQRIWKNTANTDKGKQDLGRAYWYTNSVYEDIQKYMKTYGNDDKGWEHIAQMIWRDYVGSENYSLAETFKSYADEAIAEVVSTLGSGMNGVEKGLLQDVLFKYIAGDDSEINLDEYNSMGKKISEFILKFFDDFSGDLYAMSPESSLKYIGRELFGNYFEILFDEDQIEEAIKDTEFLSAVSEAFSELLNAGFTSGQIAEALKGKSLFDWDKMADMMADGLRESLKEKFGVGFLGEIVEDLDTGDIEEDTLMWNLLDVATLKLISDLADTGVSLEEIHALMDQSADVDEFTEKMKELGDTLGVEVTEGAEEAGKTLADYVKDIKNAKSEVANLDKLFKKGTENGTLTFEDIIGSGLADAHPELLLLINDYGALIARIKELKELEVNGVAEAVAGVMWNSTEEAKRSPYAEQIREAGVDTLKEYRDMLEMAGKDVSDIDEYVNRSAEAIKEAAQDTEEAAETWLEAQEKIIRANEELNWAKSNKFAEQLGNIGGAYGGEEYDTDWMESGFAALDRWETYDEEMKKSIADTYPNLIKAIREVEEAEKNRAKNGDEALINASKKLNAELEKIEKRNSAKYFRSTYEAIEKLEKGTISAADAYDVFNDELDKVTKAQEDINDVTQKLADNTEVAENDVSNLASLLGISADQILQDFPGAVDLFNELIGETGDLRAAFDALNEAAFIRITGTSVADFSELQEGLVSVQNLAKETIELLKATGQWDTETISLPQEAFVWDPENEQWIRQTIEAGATVLGAKANNPYKGTSSTGRTSTDTNKKKSGGGSGSNKNTGMTEVERILNRMDQVHAIQEYQQSFYQAQNANFEQNGYLQGVIDASQKEIDVLTAQNQTLESNIATIEQLIAAKKKELEETTVSSEKYEEIADDLDKLQKAHQNYSKELIENKTSIDKLNESIDEQQKKIRDMQINIRSMIYKAIEDREKKAQNMLNGEIELENKILEIIKKKYETERDRIIENTEARISALQEERDLLSEQLELRKKMADAEDKAAKLATLEANLKRISADPTRQKEARNIRDQINDLRKEIAWDVAEEEVKAQEDSIDQQITSLEDYKQYVQEYYDDLFKHPQEMIEKMREIIMGTDEEIIDWLKKNDEDFANSSEKTQEKMIGDWTETVDKMRGTVRTYWEEVEKIIAGGDEAIIQFLMENSEDYAKAGKLEAEKYVEEWKKALDDLHKALQSAFTVEAPTYTVIDQGTGGSSSGGSSGGGGKKKEEDHGYSYIYGGKTYKDSGYASKDDAEEAMKKSVKKVVGGTAGTSAGYVGEAIRMIQDKAINGTEKGFKVYGKGGMATQTGPAWLDGSSSEPERVLSPYQTQLFETMVQALEKIGTINIPTMPNFGDVKTGNGNNVSVGDIIVNVDNLDTDDDYEELAKKVSDVIMDKIGRTAVVGGLRINA